jgi:hypothetical protein
MSTARPPLALDPTFRAACVAVLEAHCGQGHVFSGGTGVSCYVWVTGPSNRKGTDVRSLLGGFVLNLSSDRIYAALRAIPGYRDSTINID